MRETYTSFSLPDYILGLWLCFKQETLKSDRNIKLRRRFFFVKIELKSICLDVDLNLLPNCRDIDRHLSTKAKQKTFLQFIRKIVWSEDSFIELLDFSTKKRFFY